jgi:hypothetical protein
MEAARLTCFLPRSIRATIAPPALRLSPSILRFRSGSSVTGAVAAYCACGGKSPLDPREASERSGRDPDSPSRSRP